MSPQAVAAFKDAIMQHVHYLQALQGMSGQIPPYMAGGPEGGAGPGSGSGQATNGKKPDQTQMLRGATSPAAAAG